LVLKAYWLHKFLGIVDLHSQNIGVDSAGQLRIVVFRFGDVWLKRAAALGASIESESAELIWPSVESPADFVRDIVGSLAFWVNHEGDAMLALMRGAVNFVWYQREGGPGGAREYLNTLLISVFDEVVAAFGQPMSVLSTTLLAIPAPSVEALLQMEEWAQKRAEDGDAALKQIARGIRDFFEADLEVGGLRRPVWQLFGLTEFDGPLGSPYMQTWTAQKKRLEEWPANVLHRVEELQRFVSANR
jgi:hypothetical protein